MSKKPTSSVQSGQELADVALVCIRLDFPISGMEETPVGRPIRVGRTAAVERLIRAGQITVLGEEACQ